MAAVTGTLRLIVLVVFMTIMTVLVAPETTEVQVDKRRDITWWRRSRRCVTYGAKPTWWWAIVRESGIQIRRGNSRRVLTWVISCSTRNIIETAEAGNTWLPAPMTPKPLKEAAMPDGSMHVDSCQVSTVAPVESDSVTYWGNAVTCLTVVTLVFLAFKSGVPGIAFAGLLPVLGNGKLQAHGAPKKLESFDGWLKGIRKGSPLCELLPLLGEAMVVTIDDHASIPEGHVRILTLTKTSWVYGSEETRDRLVESIHLTSNPKSTVGKIAKYVGSLVTANRLAWLPTEGRQVVTMQEVTPTVEGEPPHEAVHDGNVFMGVSDLACIMDDNSEANMATVGRMVDNLLTKGLFHGVPDHWLPDGVLAFASEQKGEIAGTNLRDKVLMVRPGPAKHPHFDTILSIQPLFMIFGDEVNNPEFVSAVAGCFDWARTTPDRWAAAAASASDDSDDQEVEESNLLEVSRNDALKELFKAGNISEWTTPLLAADKVNAINKATRKANLAMVARTEAGSLLWSMLMEMLPYAALHDLWVRRGEVPPRDLAEKAARARILEAVNAEGCPVLYMTPKLYKRWCKNNPDYRRTVLFRRPTGTTSGTLCEVRCLPEELVMFHDEQRAYFVPTKEVFAKVWSANEGGDLDDEFVLVRGSLVNFAIRGLAWRKKTLWPDEAKRVAKVATLLKKCRDLAVKIESMDMDAINRIPGAEHILSGLFDLTVEQNAPEVGEKLVRTITAIKRKAEPKETYLGDIPGASKAHVLDLVLNLEENPFGPYVGMVANAQMWAVGLSIGWVTLPGHLKADLEGIVLASCCAMLSDVVDASVKGVGFAAAWQAVEQILLVQLYIDWQTATLGADGLAMAVPLKKRAGRGLKALMNNPTVLTRSHENGLDGLPIYEPAKEGRKIITAIRCSGLEFTLYTLWENFAAWLKNWATGQISAVKDTGGAGLLSLITADESGKDPANSDRVPKAYVHLGAAMDQVKVRRKIFERMEYGYQRDPLERKRLQAFVSLPTREAFAKIEKQFGTSLSPEEYDRLLVGIASVAMRSPRPLTIEEDYSTGTFRAWGGIPTIAFFTDVEDARGTWIPVMKLLKRKLIDEEFQVVRQVSLRVGKDARNTDAQALVGKNIEEILSMPGMQIAFSAATISSAKLCGARNQDPLAGRLALMLAPYQNVSAAKKELWAEKGLIVDDEGNTTIVYVSENELKGKTSWEVAGLLAYQEVVRAVIPGTVTEVKVTEGVGLESQALVDADGVKTYVKVPPTILEITLN
jgi:hypothetical protein